MSKNKKVVTVDNPSHITIFVFDKRGKFKTVEPFFTHYLNTKRAKITIEAEN